MARTLVKGQGQVKGQGKPFLQLFQVPGLRTSHQAFIEWVSANCEIVGILFFSSHSFLIVHSLRKTDLLDNLKTLNFYL